jgi:hypothetical protein
VKVTEGVRGVGLVKRSDNPNEMLPEGLGGIPVYTSVKFRAEISALSIVIVLPLLVLPEKSLTGIEKLPFRVFPMPSKRLLPSKLNVYTLAAHECEGHAILDPNDTAKHSTPIVMMCFRRGISAPQSSQPFHSKQ